MTDTYVKWAKSWERIIDNTAEEIKNTPWWKIKRQQYLRSRLRFASFQKKKCEETVKNKKE